jgi:hypothetical protein
MKDTICKMLTIIILGFSLLLGLEEFGWGKLGSVFLSSFGQVSILKGNILVFKNIMIGARFLHPE